MHDHHPDERADTAAVGREVRTVVHKRHEIQRSRQSYRRIAVNQIDPAIGERFVARRKIQRAGRIGELQVVGGRQPGIAVAPQKVPAEGRLPTRRLARRIVDRPEPAGARVAAAHEEPEGRLVRGDERIGDGGAPVGCGGIQLMSTSMERSSGCTCVPSFVAWVSPSGR